MWNRNRYRGGRHRGPQKAQVNYVRYGMAKSKACTCSRGRAGGRDKVKVSEVRVGKDETLDSALRRFKRLCQKAGVLAEIRKREHYEKPSVRRKKKSQAAKKRRWR